MDTPDWQQLKRAVDDFGHGNVEFFLLDEEGEELDLQVERVEVDSTSGAIAVLLTEK